MNYFQYFSSPRHELEGYLNGLFSRYRVLDMQGDQVIRGVLNERFTRMRDAIKRALESFPGRYNFDRVGDETWLTITTELSGRKRMNWKLHISLFVATICTTLLVGAFREGGQPLARWTDLSLGLPFSSSIMLILLVHELGHYFAARRHGMDVSLPYFIPLPTLIGTGGAVIRMRSPMFTRRVLLDVGAAGPLAGFLVSLPVVALGLMSSHWGAHPSGFFHTGNSLLFSWLAHLIVGPQPPGTVLQMSSVAFAGWIGFLVTAMNLIPIGQLDGGHIGYALFGRRHTRIAYVFFLLLLGLGYFWSGWFLWAAMILLLIRVKHPPVLDEEVPLNPLRRAVGVATILILFLTFMPVPIQG